MASVPKTADQVETTTDSEVIYVSPEDGRRMFDEVAREWVGMSGEEFLRRYDAGEFADMPDDEAHRRHIDLILLRHFAR
jgi:hypothetical protein